MYDIISFDGLFIKKKEDHYICTICYSSIVVSLPTNLNEYG